MSVSDRLLLRKRAIIETVNDELKNIAQVEHSRHRCFDNFIVNLLGAIAAYCLFPKKPCINVQRTIDTQLTLFCIRRTHVKIKPNRLLEPKHILFYYRTDCLTLGRRRSGLRQVTKTSKMLDNKIC